MRLKKDTKELLEQFERSGLTVTDTTITGKGHLRVAFEDANGKPHTIIASQKRKDQHVHQNALADALRKSRGTTDQTSEPC